MSEKQKAGAGWLKTTKSGKQLVSISIEINGEKKRFSMWKNEYKEEGDNKPDYVIYVDDYQKQN